MIGSRCLLDTSVIIGSFRRINDIGKRLEAMDEIYVPSIVEGELYFGAYNSQNPAKHIMETRAFLQNCRPILPDSATAEIYGSIKAILVKKGNPIPENDIWIAAISQQYSIPLYTLDKHFQSIESITIIN